VSRSSALASKATGFPIAKVAAKLAVGYTLDELQNDITGGVTPASFEPSIDYVVTKIPRFAFEKFPQANDRLTTQMKSVGEVMAIGRNFQESVQKALRGLEVGACGFDSKINLSEDGAHESLIRELREAGPDRIWYIGDAFRAGMSVDEVFALTNIDPWFLVQIEDLIRDEAILANTPVKSLDETLMRKYKRKGFSDLRMAHLLGVSEKEFRKKRWALGVRPVYKRVDTCAAEFASDTAYMYSSYDEECEAAVSDREKIMVIGGGPNRIGQGIEFDYCCVHASLSARENGYETIMVNCNPETVSTDYDTSDRLYFEPVTLEDVLEIIELEKPKGVIVQYGGQTPLKLARELEAAGAPIIGTSPDAIDRAEDRERFQVMVERLNLLQPENGTARSLDEAVVIANQIGYPLVVRPSYVLGGRAMEIVYREEELRRYMNEAVQVSNDAPVLLDYFLDDAIEMDIDCVSDGEQVVIGAIMQHIEQAGIHSGDSACSLPPYSLPKEAQDMIREQVTAMALELNVVGLMNVQMAWQDGKLYIIEVNPRASRTVPFVSKAIGRSLAKIGTQVMTGQKLSEIGFTEEIIPSYFSVKEAVMPFNKFHGVDPVLSPEMKSTGEVMGTGETFAEAFAKAAIGAGAVLPKSGKVIISVKDSDKTAALAMATDLTRMGFEVVATKGTAAFFTENGLPTEPVNKVKEGRPHLVDLIKNDEVAYVMNTTAGRQSMVDSAEIRKGALQHKVYYTTTLAGAEASVLAMQLSQETGVNRLQDLHAR
ncbi:MAG: carbamoyl-phosphate synthase large subunit, partial [Reinekea sp.]|nr:carbamoyl-phosphate synthase large subunit [Reinekea sp.]